MGISIEKWSLGPFRGLSLQFLILIPKENIPHTSTEQCVKESTIIKLCKMFANEFFHIIEKTSPWDKMRFPIRFLTWSLLFFTLFSRNSSIPIIIFQNFSKKNFIEFLQKILESFFGNFIFHQLLASKVWSIHQVKAIITCNWLMKSV